METVYTVSSTEFLYLGLLNADTSPMLTQQHLVKQLADAPLLVHIRPRIKQEFIFKAHVIYIHCVIFFSNLEVLRNSSLRGIFIIRRDYEFFIIHRVCPHLTHLKHCCFPLLRERKMQFSFLHKRAKGVQTDTVNYDTYVN